MKLERFHGNSLAVRVVVLNRIMLAQMPDGKWMALNGHSDDPCDLRNRAERSAWAMAQGLKVKDVENYVRREKRRKLTASVEEQLQDAARLLENHGYTVVKDGQK